MNNHNRISTWLSAGVLALSPLFTSSLAAGAQPAPLAEVAGESLRATVTGVEGVVQVREAADAPWQKAVVGMVLGEGAEFRTGPRSAVRFTIPPEQTITLDRLGTVKLIEAVRNQARVKTDLGMAYGRVRYDIEAAGQDHYASTISSPGAALAVRGTRVSLYDQPPFAPQATSLTGVAEFRNLRRQMVAFGAKGKNQKTEIRSDATSAAETAEDRSLLADFAVQQSEQRARELSYLFAHQGAALGNVATSNTPVPDADLPQLLPGRLNFVLRWSSSLLGDFSDLNIAVANTRGETFGNPPFIFSLFPNNPNTQQFLRENLPSTSPSGGFVGLNHIGPEGIEIASFGDKAPPGTYVVSAYNFIPLDTKPSKPSGPKIPFKLEVFLDGKRQNLILNLPEVLAGKENPVFGKVFEDQISIGERSDTALNIPSSAARAPATGSRSREIAPRPPSKPRPGLKPARAIRATDAARPTSKQRR